MGPGLGRVKAAVAATPNLLLQSGPGSCQIRVTFAGVKPVVVYVIPELMVITNGPISLSAVVSKTNREWVAVPDESYTVRELDAPPSPTTMKFRASPGPVPGMTFNVSLEAV